MNVADLFKSKPDKPIDALVQELLKDNSTNNAPEVKQSRTNSDADAVVDIVLGKGDTLPIGQ